MSCPEVRSSKNSPANQSDHLEDEIDMNLFYVTLMWIFVEHDSDPRNTQREDPNITDAQECTAGRTAQHFTVPKRVINIRQKMFSRSLQACGLK